MMDRQADPTPHEIEARAAEIRASWTPAEHNRRRHLRPSLLVADFERVRQAARSQLDARLQEYRSGETPSRRVG